jgi:hypothetical protein
MAGGDYRKYRQENSDVSATARINTTGASGGLVLASGVASGCIFIQRVTVVPITTGAVNWSLTDSSSGTPAITPLISMTGSGYNQDYGSRGVQLNTGANFQATISATGAAGVITFEGYWKYTGGASVLTALPSGASGTTP